MNMFDTRSKTEQAYDRVSQALDEAILMTPTGPDRELLTELNLRLLSRMKDQVGEKLNRAQRLHGNLPARVWMP